MFFISFDKGLVLHAPPCGLCRLIKKQLKPVIKGFSVRFFPNQTSYMKVICIEGLMNKYDYIKCTRVYIILKPISLSIYCVRCCVVITDTNLFINLYLYLLRYSVI